MNARRRDKSNQGLTTYLYDDGEYWKYKYPTRKPIRWKKSKLTLQQANSLANMLTAQYAPDPVQSALAKATRIRSPHTVKSVIEGFRREYIPERNLAANTIDNIEYKLRKYENSIGQTAFSERVITVSFLNDLFKTLTKNAYVKHRALWIDLCRYAITAGALPIGYNPAEATMRKKEAKRQRERIKTHTQYISIYQHAEPCVQIAMDFALITLQSGLEVVRFKLPRRDDDKIRVVRQKTRDHIAIDVGDSLKTIFKRSRRMQADSGIISPFLVWRKPERNRKAKGREHYTQLTRSQLSKLFKRAVEKSGLFAHLPRDRWPTPHELRSYGRQCYKRQNADPNNIRNLLGHEDEKTSYIYDEDQNITPADWKHANADLDITKLGELEK